MIVAIVTFNVKPEKYTSFLEIMESVKQDLPHVEGCDAVQLFEAKDKSGTFTLVESWESELIHQQHLAGVVESGNWAIIESHLQEPVQSAYFDRL